MSQGQVPVTAWDHTVARALGGIDAQLVADVGDMLGRVPSYADIMDAGHRWGTTTTDTLLRILEDAYPPPPEGWGLTQTTTTHSAVGTAHMKERKTRCRR